VRDAAGVTLAELQALKRDGRKIAGVVAWDTPTARLLDAAGVDLVSVGDSVGVNLWGREREGDVTVDELALLCRAVRRGVARAVVSCDLPEPTVENVRRLLDAGADVVKVERGAAELAAAGLPVFAQLDGSGGDADGLVAEARRLEAAGAALLDVRHSGAEAGARVAAAVAIPVLGGLGGGPWLDGRIRLLARLVDTSQLVADAVAAYVDDVRGARPVRGD
jgi:3-methyl-2-oxobutanoate hydroxymethyltransferase